MDTTFDLIVIGGGPGGYVAAIRGAQHGMKTALIEKGQLGGACLNRGCIPTKTLMHTAALYREVLEGEDLGLLPGGMGYDIQKMHGRKDRVVAQLRDGVAALLEANGVSRFAGIAQVTAPGKVAVSGAEPCALTGKHILLAVGASPGRPPIKGAEHPAVVTSDDLLDGAPKDYRSLVVIGGGVIGVEMASLYRNLGAEVSIVETAPRILPQLDREMAQNLTMILKKRGITVHTGCTVQEILPGNAGLAQVKVADKTGAEQMLEGQGVLLATGRVPSLEGLLGPGVELAADRGIVVNDRFETSLPGVYAIGDCVSGNIQLAHVASAQATNAVAMMAGKEGERNLNAIPGCIYTDPEIATVGITAEEAKRDGIAAETSKYIMSGNGKSVIEGQERGFVKLVFAAETQVLLGAQLMCGRATDLIGELATAVSCGCTAKELARVIHPHPTFGEGIGEAVEGLFNEAIHVMPKRKRT